MKGYYHLCANGRLVRRFLVSDTDYYAAFNLIGVCAAHAEVSVLAYSIEESHPHLLIYGEPDEVKRYKSLYETSYIRHVVVERGGLDGVVFQLQIIPVEGPEYLKTVGTYIISQSTKDGKPVMPYDYRWGTGSMYFRPEGHTSIWRYNDHGNKLPAIPIGDLPVRQQMRLLHSKRMVPAHWKVCNGFLLPENYVDVRHFEGIYRTHNCFRAFSASGRNKDMEMLSAIAVTRGVLLDDREARRISREESRKLFGVQDTRQLTADQRLSLARVLRQENKLSLRQVADLALLPEEEINYYLR